MANTIATLPGTVTQAGTGVDWVIYDAIKAYRSGSGVSKELTETNYGFTIPTVATVTGIVVAIAVIDTVGTTSNDNSLRLRKTSGAVGDDKASAAYYGGAGSPDRTYGSSTDLWGTTWTPAEINSSDFGVFLKTNKPSTSGDIYVDYFKITIHYTVPNSGALFFAQY